MSSARHRPENTEGAQQLALLRSGAGGGGATTPRAKPRTWRGAPLAEGLPVARVLVDKGQLHLDRYFDYAVPAALDAEAQPGVRVRVRFGAGERGGRREGGRLINGFVVERRADSDFRGTLAPLAQVLSTEPVLTPRLLRLCRAVADRYAGSLADVVQLAVPPRMARAERRSFPAPPPPPAAPAPGGWTEYPEGPGYLAALASGGDPRAVWTALPGPQWPDSLARAIVAALAGGRGALALLPDGRAAARVDAALTGLVGPDHHVLLTADAGAEARYGRWLAVSRGSVRAVIGTRAAAFAPVQDLGLIAIWDDGDSSYRDEHAPQPHAREVLLLRTVAERTALLAGGHGATAETAQLLASGWARPLAPARETLRSAAPQLRTVEEHDEARDEAARSARLPSLAWRTVRDALTRGPVLVQVPRRGYAPRLSCAECRESARCVRCPGPLESTGAEGDGLRCAWCGRNAAPWHCPHCGGGRLRARVIGARRTAEELGRAFPSLAVRTSGRDQILESVPDRPALVVSTPGAEPVVADGPGYAAALFLDGWALLGRPDLRAGEEALRRWLNAASLVRPAPEGGTVLVLAEPGDRSVQALVRWDPGGHAERELTDRAALGLPPVSRMASVTGPPEAVSRLLSSADLPPGAATLGPVDLPITPPGRPRRTHQPPPGETWHRVLVRVPPAEGTALAAALRAARAARLAHADPAVALVRIDPTDIG